MIFVSNNLIRAQISQIQFMLYIRYLFETAIKEDNFFRDVLLTRTTDDEKYKKFVKNVLKWKLCVGFCSDGTRDMTNKYRFYLPLK